MCVITYCTIVITSRRIFWEEIRVRGIRVLYWSRWLLNARWSCLKGLSWCHGEKKTIVLDVTLELHHSCWSFHFYESRASEQLAVGSVLSIVDGMHACMYETFTTEEQNRKGKFHCSSTIDRCRKLLDGFPSWEDSFMFLIGGVSKEKKERVFPSFSLSRPFSPLFSSFPIGHSDRGEKENSSRAFLSYD